MSENFVDFRIVKERVSIEDVLDRYHVRLRRINNTSLRGQCPLPTHSSKESKDSFCVNTAKNIWSCQSNSCASARQGKRGGNVIDLVAVLENSSIRDAAVKLHDWFLSVSSPPANPVGKGSALPQKTGALVSEKNDPLPTAAETINKPLSFTLKDIDCSHAYVRERGLTDDTAKYFGVGFFPGKGLMSGRCVIPIHNEVGELVAYAGRSIDAIEPKYKLPAGFKKSAVLYNLHRAIEVGEKRLIIVEGFFDCMHVHQAGFANVVALMGSTMSDEQERLLVERADQVLVLLDGDDAGRAGAIAIAARLVHKVFVKVINMPDGKQPDQLPSDEIKTLFSI